MAFSPPDLPIVVALLTPGELVALGLLALGLVGLALVFLAYPTLLSLRAWLAGDARSTSTRSPAGPSPAGPSSKGPSATAPSQTPPALPTVTLLCAVRNGAAGIATKIYNALDSDYPSDRLDVVVSDDGSDDGTARVVEGLRSDPRTGGRLTLLETSAHDGKAAALNRAAPGCRGEIIVFSDADALLEPGALRALVAPFADSGIGGVCGRRVIGESEATLESAQSDYIAADSALKVIESCRGSITSNDGKLYAIRRELFRPIDPEATDDLFTCLGVISQGFRFVFEPRARARVRVPSRSGRHEVGRRRRIVARSLRGIYLHRALLNPFRTGLFAVGLFINKILRRCIPLFLIAIFAASVILAFRYPAAQIFLGLQLLFYALAASYPLLANRLASRRHLRRAFQAPFYFCVGNYGTLLGLLSFLCGQRVSRWNPRKSDEPSPLSEGAPPC